MNKNKLLKTMGTVLVALLSVVSVETAATAKPVHAVVYNSYNDPRLFVSRKTKLSVYHARPGYNHFYVWQAWLDDDFEPIMKKWSAEPLNKTTHTVIAPVGTKHDLVWKGVKYHPVMTFRTNGWIPESVFQKTFAKGGLYTDGLYGQTESIRMKNTKVLKGYKWIYKSSHALGLNTMDKVFGAQGSKNIKYAQQWSVFYNMEYLDPNEEDTKEDFKHDTDTLRRWGFPEAKIKKILDRQKMIYDWPDTHDDYNSPDFIQSWMFQDIN